MEPNARQFEKRSSAVTLSDMELFVFPDLLYAILLANVLSPRLWAWRNDPWFEGIGRLKPYRRVTRLKQYIMDHYAFNLDLDTWGLTTKATEIGRFRPFIDPETIRQANALFGYEGDKYYFDIDIRTHFGLDKYDGDVIPYWKTETVEAMDAFRHKPNYGTGAGECVSLAALYAAALFVVARIPLSHLYLMATPLHSQNFVDTGDGILTNNRRIVTKAMWFNGTALSAQARRALENERVTIVAHESGWVHTVYPGATMDPKAYAHFAARLRAFLKTDLTQEILGNFLRHKRDLQKCFQLRCRLRDADGYVAAERAFDYEHGSSHLLTDSNRAKLLSDIDPEDCHPARLPGRIVLDDLEAFVHENRIRLDVPEDVARLKERFACDCLDVDATLGNLTRFCDVEPRLPEAEARQWQPQGMPLGLTPDMDREQVLARIESLRGANETADLAFYAYRDLNRTEAGPFLEAAILRNPVSIQGAREMSDAEAAAFAAGLPDESIYDEPGRLAQPDEVWNFGRGDGVERALLLANVLRHRHPEAEAILRVEPDRAELSVGSDRYGFPSRKRLRPAAWRLAPGARPDAGEGTPSA